MRRYSFLFLISFISIFALIFLFGCSTTPDECIHSFGEWSITSDSDCTTMRERKRVCALCGSVEVEMIAPEHKGEWTVISAPSCTAGGVNYRKCTRCGIEEYRNVEALGHKGVWEIVSASTCTQVGSRRMTCTVCGETVTEETVALGHEYGEWLITKQATCLTGDKESVCARCGDVKHEEIPADYSAHVFDEGVCTLCGERTATEGLRFELTDRNTLAVAGYTGRDVDVQVPSYYGGLIVTEIRENAFKDKSAITSLTIPRSVTTIAAGCLSGCSSLERLTIPFVGRSLSYPTADAIEEFRGKFGTFFGEEEYEGGIMIKQDSGGWSSWGSDSYCLPASLRKVKVEGGDIRICAFDNCSMLTEIALPSGVTSIGYYAFHGCTGLASVSIPDSVTSIGAYAFQDCIGLTSITIPNGVKSIGSSAFSGCCGLTSITIPDTVTSIERNAFYVREELTSITYQGTTAQWEAISKNPSWYQYASPRSSGSAYFLVHCTDGEVRTHVPW